jgi:GABA(A) receptor-associated protein
MGLYKNSVPVSKRKADAERVLLKYPDYIPVIIDKSEEISKLITKQKFLVPRNVSCAHLLNTIRMMSNNKINPSQALFLFCNNILVMPQDSIEYLYNKYKDKIELQKIIDSLYIEDNELDLYE